MRWTSLHTVFLSLSSLVGLGSATSVQHQLQSATATDTDAAASEYVTGVGMDLTSNYGTVAAAYANGTIVNIAKIEGSEAYLEMMHRLSLDSSRHLTPPYTNFPDAAKDGPRQAERRRRKSQGLPASPDVGVLAEMLSALHHEAEVYLNHDIQSALAATPNLVALYREDVEDTFEYLSIKSLDNPNYLYRLFREPAAVYATHGFGLCEHPFDSHACLDELLKMPYTDILTVLYTPNSLCVEISQLKSAYQYTPFPTLPTSMDFSLGSDARYDNPNEWHYWQAVRERIITALAVNRPTSKPSKIFLMGESAQDLMFRIILEDTVVGALGYNPEAYPGHEEFGAARGAAEFARRGGYFWNSSEAPPYADTGMGSRVNALSSISEKGKN